MLQFGGSGTDEIGNLAVTPDGWVVMAGMTSVLSRKPLAQLTQEGSAYAPEEPGVFCGGYVIATIDSTKKIDFEPVYRYSKGVV